MSPDEPTPEKSTPAPSSPEPPPALSPEPSHKPSPASPSASRPTTPPTPSPASPPGRRPVSARRRRLLIALAIVTGVVVLLGMGSAIAVSYYYDAVELPADSAPLASTTIYYSDGKTMLARLGAEARFPIDTMALPNHVRAAVLSAEDRDFYKNSMMPAAITLQLARSIAELSGRSPRLLAVGGKLEQMYSKDEILNRYLNRIYFGRSAYGIEAGALAYFGKSAKDLTAEEAIVLGGVIESPGNGAYDPVTNPDAAKRRWEYIKDGMVDPLGVLDATQAAAMAFPTTAIQPDAGVRQVAAFVPSGPSGLVVSHVLAELRRLPVMKGAMIPNEGFQVVTTIDPTAQRSLERQAGPTGTVLSGQPYNLQAAAVVVQPKTGRVLAYYGGNGSVGADYAHWFVGEDGTPTGFGFHPPASSFAVYDLAEALRQGISIRSRWQSPQSMMFPRSRPSQPLIDVGTCPTGGTTCTLADAVIAGLNVPLYAVTERVRFENVLATARSAGIDSMRGMDGSRVDLRNPGTGGLLRRFSPEVGIGQYPITVLDHATGMATFAARGERSRSHFVLSVSKDGRQVHREAAQTQGIGLNDGQLDDLTWTLAQNPAGRLADGRQTAAVTGTWPIGTSRSATSNAWIAGFVPQYGVAVWLGNRAEEQPLKDRAGSPVTGATLPAQIYRAFLGDMLAGTPGWQVPAPAYTGDANAGNA